MFIRDTLSFLRGAIIGMIMHTLFLKVFGLHARVDSTNLICIGIFQIICIAGIRSIGPPEAMFTIGLVSAQELFISRVYPRNAKN